MPWLGFKKRQLQKNLEALVKTGTVPLSYDQIIVTLNRVLCVDIAIHTPKEVYANRNCDPEFANFSGKALFGKPCTLIRHEIASNRPEHKILSRHKCDVLASLFFEDQFVGAVRFGRGLTDRLYSNYDLTLLDDLLMHLRLSLFYGNATLPNSASVILHHLGGKVCSIQKNGNVSVYMVDHDNQNTFTEKDAGRCRFMRLPPNISSESDLSDMKAIRHAVRFCPECGSPRIYTAVQKTCLFDHQKQQIAEVLQTVGPLEQGTHGCFDCLHQWRSIPAAEPACPQPPNVIDFNAHKTTKH